MGVCMKDMRIAGVRRSGIQRLIGLGSVWLLFLCMVLHATAEEKTAILQSVQKGDHICLFLNGPAEYDSVTGQIGREPVEIVSTDKNTFGHTIILIDNSLSVTEENFAKACAILEQYVSNKTAGEKVSLAVFGTDIQYLTEKETDGEKVLAALDSIQKEDKDTYLTDLLYDEMMKLEGKTEYTRFIVVTDGVDNKEIGYNKEELSAYLIRNPYPVYALGCRYKNNEEQLKDLFAISRATQAGYYLLDDYEEYDEIAAALQQPVNCVEIEVPEEFRDGSSRNILLKFEGPDGTTEAAAELPMPFGLRDEDAEPEETSVKEETVEESPAESPKAEPNPKNDSVQEPMQMSEPVLEPMQEQEKETPVDFISVLAVVVVIIAVAVLIVVNRKKKKAGDQENDSDKINQKKASVKKNKQKNQSVMQFMDEPEPDDGCTVLAADMEEGGTVFLDSSERARYLIVLKDNKDPEKVFRYPLSDKVVIGRRHEVGVHIVLNYDSTVSARHCEISIHGNRFFVRDLHSSNKTYLNGKVVGEDTEFMSGDTLRIGNLEMTIEIEQTTW